MARSPATTVTEFLAELPPERRKIVSAVRKVIRANLPKGYEESMGLGMIAYSVPLKRYPDTYNGHPLTYAALAAQKNGYSLHLMSIYGHKPAEEKLRAGFKAAEAKNRWTK